MATPTCVDYIDAMAKRIVALCLLLTTCGVEHPEAPAAELAWDEGSEAGWTVASAGYVQLPARHITKTVSADEKLVALIDATGATFIARVRRGQTSATLLPAEEMVSSSGRLTHLTVDQRRLSASGSP